MIEISRRRALSLDSLFLLYNPEKHSTLYIVFFSFSSLAVTVLLFLSLPVLGNTIPMFLSDGVIFTPFDKTFVKVIVLTTIFWLYIFFIKKNKIFSILKTIKDSIIFRLILTTLFIIFYLIDQLDYYDYLGYIILTLIGLNLIFSKEKKKYIYRLIFIILLWSLLYYILDLILLYNDNNVNEFIYIFLSYFLYDQFYLFNSNEGLDSLIEVLNSYGFSPLPPNSPNPDGLLAFLGGNDSDSNDWEYKKSHPHTVRNEDDEIVFKGYSYLFTNNLTELSFKVRPFTCYNFNSINDTSYVYKGISYDINKITNIITQHNIGIENKMSALDKLKFYYKTFFLKDYIEKNKNLFPDIFAYIKSSLYPKPVSNVTPLEFLVNKHEDLSWHMQEYSVLLYAKTWYEAKYLNNNIDNLGKEYCEAYEYWQKRQIDMYQSKISLSKLYDGSFNKKYPITNWFKHEEVYEEIIENTFFVLFKILETKCTIDKCKSFNKKDLEYLTKKKDLINFYNNLYDSVKGEITSKYAKEYSAYVKVWKDRYHSNENDKWLDSRYLRLQMILKQIPLNEETFYKKYSDMSKNIDLYKYKYKTKIKVKILKKKVKFKHKMPKYKQDKQIPLNVETFYKKYSDMSKNIDLSKYKYKSKIKVKILKKKVKFKHKM